MLRVPSPQSPIPISRPQLSDATLVVEARRSIPPTGDAFGELVQRYQRMVYALAMSLVQPSDLDDVVECAIAALDRLPARYRVRNGSITRRSGPPEARAAARERAGGPGHG